MTSLFEAKMIALVAFGAVFGTFVRAGFELLFPPQSGAWPWTTFVINLSGAFVLGTLLAFLGASGPDEGWRKYVRLGVGTGVLGGYTTYSTFILEVSKLSQVGVPWLGFAYLGASLFIGVVFAYLGLVFGAKLASCKGPVS